MPSLPSSPKDPFDTVSSEIRVLRQNWVMYRRLFDIELESVQSPEKAVELGDEAYRVTGQTSERFFRLVRFQMLRGAIQDLCRLCDRKKVAGKANLTLERILELTDFKGSSTLRRQAVEAKERAYELVRDPKGIWGLRNKMISHFDLDTALGKVPPIDVAVVQAVNLATRHVVRFQEIITAARTGRQDEEPSTEDDDWRREVENLVDILDRGLRSQAASHPPSTEGTEDE